MNEVAWDFTPGETLDLYRFQLDGHVFLSNGASDEEWGTGGRDADNYDVAIPEVGDSGHYVGHFDNVPNIVAGIYKVQIRVRAGVNPADDDVIIACGVIEWDGSVERKGSAYTWHVAKDGNDDNDGHSIGDAKLTVAAAVAAATAGDTIVIWPGDYVENADASAKELNFLGVSRNHSKIVPATGTALKVDDNSTVKNLSLEALEIAEAGRALDCSGKTNVILIDVDMYGGYDGLYAYMATGVRGTRCRIRGKYDGVNLAVATSMLFTDSSFIALGTYGTGVPCRAMVGSGTAVFNNCIFRSVRSDATTDKACGGIYVADTSQWALNNCSICVNGTNMSGDKASVFGVMTQNANAVVSISNCAMQASGDAEYINDLWNVTGSILVSSSQYSSSTGTIDCIEKLIYADKVVDTSGSPWVLEYRDKDTAEVLLRQEMKNTSDEVIVTTRNVLGRLELE